LVRRLTNKQHVSHAINNWEAMYEGDKKYFYSTCVISDSPEVSCDGKSSTIPFFSFAGTHMLADMNEFLDEVDMLVVAFNHRGNSDIEFVEGGAGDKVLSDVALE
jgi:hypothetical protein